MTSHQRHPCIISKTVHALRHRQATRGAVRLKAGELDMLRPAMPALQQQHPLIDLGYELWFQPEHALAGWDAIFAVQGLYDIHAMGLDALEMVRIEAGFIMPGFDFNCAESTVRAGHDRTPDEVGLGWLVQADKGHFTGRQAILAARKKPLQRLLSKLVVEGNKPVGEAFVYAGKDGKQVGEVKCTTWSPVLKANLALADIECQRGELPADRSAPHRSSHPAGWRYWKRYVRK